MKTSTTITSHVDCISDETLAELLPIENTNVILRSVARPAVTSSYGTWRLSADLEVNGRKITITTTTHEEDLKTHYVDQSEWNNMSEPTMTEGEAAESILFILFAANEDELNEAAEDVEEEAGE